MAVVVTGLEIFGDVGKSREILWILSCTRDVTDLMFRYDILQRQNRLLITSTEQIILLFIIIILNFFRIIYLILNAQKHNCCRTVLLFPFVTFMLGQLSSFSYRSVKIYFLLFSFHSKISQARNHIRKSPMGPAHGYSIASSLYEFPF